MPVLDTYRSSSRQLYITLAGCTSTNLIHYSAAGHTNWILASNEVGQNLYLLRSGTHTHILRWQLRIDINIFAKTSSYSVGRLWFFAQSNNKTINMQNIILHQLKALCSFLRLEGHGMWVHNIWRVFRITNASFLIYRVHVNNLVFLKMNLRSLFIW